MMSRVVTSFLLFDFRTFSVTNSTLMRPCDIWPSIFVAVASNTGIILRIMLCGMPSCENAFFSSSYPAALPPSTFTLFCSSAACFNFFASSSACFFKPPSFRVAACAASCMALISASAASTCACSSAVPTVLLCSSASSVRVSSSSFSSSSISPLNSKTRRLAASFCCLATGSCFSLSSHVLAVKISCCNFSYSLLATSTASSSAVTFSSSAFPFVAVSSALACAFASSSERSCMSFSSFLCASRPLYSFSAASSTLKSPLRASISSGRCNLSLNTFSACLSVSERL